MRKYYRGVSSRAKAMAFAARRAQARARLRVLYRQRNTRYNMRANAARMGVYRRYRQLPVDLQRRVKSFMGRR